MEIPCRRSFVHANPVEHIIYSCSAGDFVVSRINSRIEKNGYFRAHPGSEFVVANTLTKWEKLEPNEINISQDFSQKVVSTSCFAFNSLPARGNFCCLLITFANILSGLIWIQTV